MALSSNVLRRGATYYLRVAVPVDLQTRLKRKEVWRSLRTKDPKAARRLGPEALARQHAEWERMRGEERAAAPLTEIEITEAAASFYAEELRLDELVRANRPTAEEIEALKPDPECPAFQARLEGLDGEALQVAILAESLEFLTARDTADYDQDRRAKLLATLKADLRKGETQTVRWAAKAEELHKRAREMIRAAA